MPMLMRLIAGRSKKGSCLFFICSPLNYGSGLSLFIKSKNRAVAKPRNLRMNKTKCKCFVEENSEKIKEPPLCI